MREYTIYIRQNSAKPYMIHFFDNIDSAKLKLYEMIALEEERGRPYFVDNNFFVNKYHMAGKLKYYCIKEREVSEWKKYSEEENLNINNNRIIYIDNFRKSIDKIILL